MLSAALLLLLSRCALAQVQYLGIAIAGADIGCDIQGACPLSEGHLPVKSLGGADGVGQMKHFAEDDGVNMFRLPISWQFLVNSDDDATAPLDDDQVNKYDQLVQACLDTGAHCILDLHNFARFDGAIIGQYDTDANGNSASGYEAAYVSLWTTLAKRYAKEARVVFGLMNEPHDLPGDNFSGGGTGITRWAQTCQKAVTAIRGAGATTQMILLPGTNFASAETFVTTGSAAALLAVEDTKNATAGLLLLDVHKYLDEDNSGSKTECTTNNTASFGALATYLRAQGRQALISETGAAAASESCRTDFCVQNAFINANADVYVGYVAWGAGAFNETYVLTLTPTLDADGKYEDNDMMKECVLGPWQKAGGKSSLSPASSSSSSSSTKTSSASKTSSTKSSSTKTASSSTTASTTATASATTAVPAISSAPAATGTTEQTANSANGAGVVQSACAAWALVLAAAFSLLLL